MSSHSHPRLQRWWTSSSSTWWSSSGHLPKWSRRESPSKDRAWDRLSPSSWVFWDKFIRIIPILVRLTENQNAIWRQAELSWFWLLLLTTFYFTGARNSNGHLCDTTEGCHYLESEHQLRYLENNCKFLDLLMCSPARNPQPHVENKCEVLICEPLSWRKPV